MTGNERNTIIESLGVYLPPRAVSTSEVLRGCRHRVRFPLEGITGIRNRRVAQGEYSIDLARKAVGDCLRQSRYAPRDIDLLICCNISRYDAEDFCFSYEPNTAVKLRAHFAFDNALAFDITNACAGMFTALMIAKGFLNAGRARRVIIVSGEYITHLTETAQQEISSFMDSRLACLTVGDAGVAMIVEQGANGSAGFHEIDLYTIGRYSSYCVGRWTDPPIAGAIMLTDAVRLTALAIKQSVIHAAHVLQKAGWGADTFQHLIMHQTSETTLNGVAKAINARFARNVCHQGNTIVNVAERGNTASTSHFLALAEHIMSGRINTGDRLVFGISASGVTAGTALYTLDDLPDRMRRPATVDGSTSTAHSTAPANGPVPAVLPRVRIESVGLTPDGQPGPRDAIKLAASAAERCLAASSWTRSDIFLLLHAGVYRNGFICEPAIAAFVAGEVGMNDDVESVNEPRTLAFDVFNGGVGFLNACCVAARLLQARAFERAMIVTSEVENNAGLSGVPLRGVHELGSALILDIADGNPESGFGEFVFHYFPEHLDAFTSTTAWIDARITLRFRGEPRLESVFLDCIPRSVEGLLSKAGLDRAAIDVVLPPQISTAFIDALAARLPLPRAAWVDATRDGADLFTSSLPHAFAEMRRRGLGKPGERGLIINVAAGAQVGCALYYF